MASEPITCSEEAANQQKKLHSSLQDNSIIRKKLVIEDDFKYRFLFWVWIFGNSTVILGKQDPALSK